MSSTETQVRSRHRVVEAGTRSTHGVGFDPHPPINKFYGSQAVVEFEGLSDYLAEYLASYLAANPPVAAVEIVRCRAVLSNNTSVPTAVNTQLSFAGITVEDDADGLVDVANSRVVLARDGTYWGAVTVWGSFSSGQYWNLSCVTSSADADESVSMPTPVGITAKLSVPFGPRRMLAGETLRLFAQHNAVSASNMLVETLSVMGVPS